MHFLLLSARYALLIFLAASTLANTHCQAAKAVFERGEVYTSGENGYNTYRLPTTVTTPDGSLLVFCDGRMFSPCDLGKINPVVRRSGDGGRTWDAIKVLDSASGKKCKIGNGSPFYDRQTNTVHFLYLKDLTQAFITSSTDGGRTFSKPREVTKVFHDFDFPWKYFATGHVHGIQTTDGRLVVPVWFSNRPRTAERDAIFTVGMIFSDDGAKTFKAGGLMKSKKFTRINENTIFECSDGSLYCNARESSMQHKARSRDKSGVRVIARSNDGGKTWSTPEADEYLPGTICQASSLVLPSKDGRHRVLFCIPSKMYRSVLKVYLSYDDGKTWPIAKEINSGPAAYGDMAVDDNGMIYVVYETGKKSAYEKIGLAKFNLEWLTDGKDSLAAKK